MTVSATPGDPITLYAQWGYTLNISMLNLASSTLTPMFLSSTSQFVITGLFDVVPDSGHVFIYVQSNVELQWITEDGSNTFTAQNGNDEYTVTFGYTSGVENVQYFRRVHCDVRVHKRSRERTVLPGYRRQSSHGIRYCWLAQCLSGYDPPPHQLKPFPGG